MSCRARLDARARAGGRSPSMRWAAALLVLVALATTACGAALVTADLSDAERCVLDRGMWRAGHCQPCGGGM